MAADLSQGERKPLGQPLKDHLETTLVLPGELQRALVARAQRFIQGHRMDPGGVVAEGAVNFAQYRLWYAVNAGKVRDLAIRQDLERMLVSILDQILLDRWRHQRRRKRQPPPRGPASPAPGPSPAGGAARDGP